MVEEHRLRRNLLQSGLASGARTRIEFRIENGTLFTTAYPAAPTGTTVVYPVKIDGEIINVAYGETGHYVSLSVPDSVKDTKLLDTIAKRLDVELATGKYDSLFGR